MHVGHALSPGASVRSLGPTSPDPLLGLALPIPSSLNTSRTTASIAAPSEYVRRRAVFLPSRPKGRTNTVSN
jgi:hypothetical protein